MGGKAAKPLIEKARVTFGSHSADNRLGSDLRTSLWPTVLCAPPRGRTYDGNLFAMPKTVL